MNRLGQEFIGAGFDTFDAIVKIAEPRSTNQGCFR